MKNYMKRCKEAFQVARLVMRIRKDEPDIPLSLIPDSLLAEDAQWLSVRNYENQLMQQCIFGMTRWETPCTYCEEHRLGVCKKPQHMGKGCEDWTLRFLTEEELEHCAASVKKAEAMTAQIEAMESVSEQTKDSPGE